ncbi:hypothetical protein N7495_004010 [Penicillium taxi]|uniref:uncharacterized protein n=1 Tax=Penicillium taxi TaxID=168475 RepID=UPI002545702F|nr:uncharacterized protein N7495_004010 [Penicillium taxi]KAJ5899266.1 hypothetical protein N7495_004010 [Penicillium taxi]
MLLERGADVNAQDGYYGHALQAACSKGHDKIAQMLLEQGADVNSQGGFHGNALQAACYKGHDRIAQMLLERGADVNSQGGEYGNALQAACFEGHDRIAQMLLERGADVNAQGGFYENAQAQAQAQNVAPQGQHVQRTQSSNPQSLNQLLPQIQAKVSALNFYLLPNVTHEQLQTWIPEARLRYGIALQKQEFGRVWLAKLRQQYAARTAQGNITSEEVPEFKNRLLSAELLYQEGSDFLAKFKEQQEGFKMQASGLNGPIAMIQTPSNQTPNAGQSQAPAPHTINSAVNAARQNSVMWPSVSQVGQPPSGSPVGTTPASTTQPLTQRSQAPSQPGASGAQVTFSQTPNLERATPTSTGPAQINQGPPRPLSASAALHQSAQSYSNPNTSQQPQQQNMNQAVNNQQARPQGYLGNRTTDTSARNNNMAIPKTLNVPTPEPVSMPAGEGQHVLSKKMLDILVRQVTGGGENEMLTPDAEEVS